MRQSKFTEDQIVQALQQVKTGTPAVQVCRKQIVANILLDKQGSTNFLRKK